MLLRLSSEGATIGAAVGCGEDPGKKKNEFDERKQSSCRLAIPPIHGGGVNPVPKQKGTKVWQVGPESLSAYSVALK